MELLSGFWSTKIHDFCTNTAELVSSYRVPTTTMHWTEDNRQTGNTVYTEVHLKYTGLAYTFGVEQCFFLTFHTTHMLLCCVCVCVCVCSVSVYAYRVCLGCLFAKHPITWTLPTAMRDISTSATTKVTIHSSLSPHPHLSLSPSCPLSPCLLVPQAFIPWMSHSVSACVKLVFWDP